MKIFIPMCMAFFAFLASHSAYFHTNILKKQAMIYVYTCDTKAVFLDLYSDKELKIPIANPFVTNRDGSYSYFADTPNTKEVISVDGHIIGQYEHCGW